MFKSLLCDHKFAPFGMQDITRRRVHDEWYGTIAYTYFTLDLFCELCGKRTLIKDGRLSLFNRPGTLKGVLFKAKGKGAKYFRDDNNNAYSLTSDLINTLVLNHDK